MGQMVPTVRVGVHQRKDGDVERVPKLPHHQPAVDIWHTFPLIGHRQKQHSRQILWIIDEANTGKHTVIMMHGESLEQKPSSRSL